MKLIVGLGNPEEKYFATRHNAGRLVVETFVRQSSLKFTPKKLERASAVKMDCQGQTIVWAYPETFMNVSGEAVARLVKHLEVDPKKDLLVVMDDFAIPFGRLRIRGKGSDGGHNGLKSIDAALGHNEYARLRFGIGPQPEQLSNTSINDQSKTPLEVFVLQAFNKSEQQVLPELLKAAGQACVDWALSPLDQVMSRINGSRPEAE